MLRVDTDRKIRPSETVRAEPTIAVIIPTFNRSRTVPQAVDSVLQQTRRPDEIIVVDDGSTDETASVLAAYEGQITVIRQENRGVSAARNRGAAAATSEWLTFLDSDDVWYPHRLAVLTGAIQSVDADVHVGNLVYKGPGYEKELFGLRGLDVPVNGRVMNSGALHVALSYPQLGSVAIRKRRFDAVNGFDETMTIHEDTHLLCRLSLSGTWVLTPEVVAEVRRVQESGPSLSSGSRTKAVYSAAMKVKVFDDLVQKAGEKAKELPQISLELSGALFELSQKYFEEGSKSIARQTLLRSAGEHPSVRGWIKILPPLLFGRNGYGVFNFRKRGFLRSDFDNIENAA